MADGQLFKPEKDYTKEADKQIPEAEELAKVGQVNKTVVEFANSRFLEQCSVSDREAFVIGKTDATGTIVAGS